MPVKKRKTEQYIVITSIPKTVFLIARESGNHAERKASEKVMTYLQAYHPLLIRTAQRFYVCEYDDVCECGIECGDGFKLSTDCELEILDIPAGRYAVLPDDRLGDIRMGCMKINLWLQNNNIAHDHTPIFAVYKTPSGKYDAENVCMKLYKRLKADTNG